jgi:hypothetical protein
MILLDTNVVSDLCKPEPNTRIQKWLDDQRPRLITVSSLTIAELAVGLALLPEGKKKVHLTRLTEALIVRFGRSSLPFDAVAARQFAGVWVSRRRRGRPIEIFDAQIAAVAIATGCTLATLNTKDFEGIEGLKVVDPAA